MFDRLLVVLEISEGRERWKEVSPEQIVHEKEPPPTSDKVKKQTSQPPATPAHPNISLRRQLQSTKSAFAALLVDGTVVVWGDRLTGGDLTSAEESRLRCSEGRIARECL